MHIHVGEHLSSLFWAKFPGKAAKILQLPGSMPELISPAKVEAKPPPGARAGAGTSFPLSDAELEL